MTLLLLLRDGIDHVAFDLPGVGDRSEDTRSRDQARTAALAATGDAHVAGHGLQEHRDRRSVIAEVALGHAVHLVQVNRFHRRVVARELADSLGGDARDGLCPFRRVRDPVDFADDVFAPFLEALRLYPLGNVVMIVEVFGVEHVCDGEPEGRVGARSDGNPLRAQNLGTYVVDRVDQDELAPALVRELHVVRDMAEPCDHRVEAPQHHELRVEQIGCLEARIRVRRALDEAIRQTYTQVEVLRRGTARGGVVAPARDRTWHIGCKREIRALECDVIAVVEPRNPIALLRHRLHLVGDGIERFFPGNPLEMPLAGAFLADALHGIQQTVFRVQLLAPCMPHRARTGLQHARLHGVLVIVLARNSRVDRIVRFDGDDLAVLDAALDQTGGIPAPVVMTRGVEILDPFVTFAQLLDN